ncbi:glutaredoxin [Phlegmacium glaucopus]|nr:glutaredoxin [Phlegmacium glaucopus]
MISRLTSALSRLPSSLSSAFFSSSNSSATQLQRMSVKQFVDDSIAENKVIIFSKSYCPYCTSVKALFTNNFPGVKFHVIELDELDDGAPIQQYLKEETGQRTVPNVFVNKEHIGGNDDTTAAWKSGKLGKLLEE